MPDRGRLDGLQVVLVEDHGDTLDILQQVLRHLGATVTAVLTAREALARVADADIVVTDYKLPEEDGVWLLEQVNQQPYPVPVLLISGFAQEQVPRLADAPFARKLLKPIDPWKLGGIIGEVLGR
jgi:CheY-like chemotaxis protein